jgi:hypothetical protein
MFEKCKCKSCKDFLNGECETYKQLKAFIKPNTDVFNYNVNNRGCYIK